MKRLIYRILVSVVICFPNQNLLIQVSHNYSMQAGQNFFTPLNLTLPMYLITNEEAI